MIRQMFSDSVCVGELTIGVTHNRDLVQRLIAEWHSVLGAPQGWRVAFLLSAGNTIVGVATWGRPVARMEDQETTLELTRMALNGAPHNSATRFMRLMRDWIRQNMPVMRRLISYQDVDRHYGTIYKADNWRKVYEKTESATWTNRARRLASERKRRAKWEYLLA